MTDLVLNQLDSDYNDTRDFILQGGYKKEYIPLFGIKRPKNTTYVYFNEILNNIKNKNSKKHKYIEELSSKNRSFIEEILSHYLYQYKNSTDNKSPIDIFEKYIDCYINSNDGFKIIKCGLFRKNIYRYLFGDIKNHNQFKYSIATHNFITNHWFLASYDDDKLEILFILVVKKEYIEYLKWCILFDDKPDNSIFEFWVLKGFDSKDTKYKLLRPKYRKEIKSQILELGIPIIEKDNFNELFYSIEFPKFKTIYEQQKWELERSKEYLTFLKSISKVETISKPLNIGDIINPKLLLAWCKLGNNNYFRGDWNYSNTFSNNNFMEDEQITRIFIFDGVNVFNVRSKLQDYCIRFDGFEEFKKQWELANE